ncbi:MAG: hypoxanthine-guanine phosphoribosyltransferase [Acidithiobacillales bacterium SM23_46]|nr:MAG: hypoxanthine-guanine phosphoribosyltransferase [Acidithiobacillales bacterium SM23_46]
MSSISPQQAWKVFEQADLVHSADAVESALDAMGVAITSKLSGTNPLLVCILTGGVVPFGKLLPRLQFPLTIDYVHATRYGDKLHGGQLHWISGPHQDPKDRTVLLVDDILDEGTTLAGIEERYRGDGARVVYKAVLVTKDRQRPNEVHIDFPGLTVPDRYVFGYGMDYKGYLRNAPGIYAEAIRK